MDAGASFDTPGTPDGKYVNCGETRVLRFLLIFCDCGATLADFFQFYENVVQCGHLKSDFEVNDKSLGPISIPKLKMTDIFRLSP